MKASKPEKFHATGIYVLVLGVLIALFISCIYFVEKPLYRFGLAAIPLLFLFTSKNSVIELHQQHFLIKNYFLLLWIRKHSYAYEDVAFVHYHRRSHIFLSGLDFWGFYHTRPIEVRFKNTQFETLSVYGASAIILKGIQAVNEHIQEKESQLQAENSNK